MERDEARKSSHVALGGAFAVLFLWILGAIAVIATDAWPGSRAALDQDNYHLMTIRKFADEWPRFDLRDYRSATTPGYHVTLAEVARLISPDLRALRVAGMLFGAALLGALARAAARFLRGVSAGAVVLPLACSLYIFSAGAWLLPDNAGWWGVLMVLLVALFRTPTTLTILFAGLLVLILVMFRQIHLWGAAVVWLWALLGGPDESPDARTRMRRVGVALLATIPAFAAVGAFWVLWKGPVPPLFQGGVYDPVVGKLSPKNSGGNPATPAFLLMLFGAYGVFFLGYLREGLMRVRRGETPAVAMVAAGALLGLALALIPRTTFDIDAGRYTGFWALVNKLPVVGGRSLFLAGGAAVGGGIVGLCAASLRRREAMIVLGALLAFTAAQSTAFAAWQRYLEPMVLITLALVAIAAARTQSGASGETRLVRAAARFAPVGPALLGALLAFITVASLRAGSAGIG